MIIDNPEDSKFEEQLSNQAIKEEESKRIYQVLNNLQKKKIRQIIDYLYSQKKYFYGDFEYSEELKRPPNPINFFNEAIGALHTAEKDLKYSKYNSTPPDCVLDILKELK